MSKFAGWEGRFTPADPTKTIIDLSYAAIVITLEAGFIAIMTKNKGKFLIKRTAHGLGLFTLEPIPPGKRIIEYTGPLVPNEEVDKRPNGKYFFGVNSKWSVDGTPRSNLARYINHSCRPNAEAIISGRRVWIWSKRAIKAGEELSYNYGKEYFDVHIKPIGCRCLKCAEKRRR